MDPSSNNLHPKHGARFVLVREGETYSVSVYTGTEHRDPPEVIETTLRFDERGHATLAPDLSDSWIREETLKLARVLKRGDKRRLTRWRAGPL